MTINTSKKRFTTGLAGFLLGGVAAGALTAAVVSTAQEPERVAMVQDGPTEARPQMAAPSADLLQQLSFADLVEEVSPAVVSIQTETAVPVRRSLPQLPPELERMLPPEFRRGTPGEDEETRRAMSQGSGFFIDANGHVVTNNHVIDGADEITVVLYDGEELEATLVGTDPATDLAVLKVEPSDKQRFVRFSPNADLRVGDYVLAVGNPFGLGGSVTSGIVSAIGREGGPSSQYADFIQIDASINRGNSGGPTFDLKGNVVGVNTAIISPTGGNVGIGLAVPADVAQEVVRQLINEGQVTRGWLGVAIGDLDDRLAAAVGLEESDGALVQSVQPDSPAEQAGFEEGDVVLRFGDRPIASASDLTRTVGGISPGEEVSATVFREGQERTLSVTLAKRDPERAAAFSGNEPETDGEELSMDLGVSFSALTDSVRDRLGLADDVTGVLVASVDPTSEAADAGIREGMIITRADSKAVASPSELEDVVKAARERGKEVVLVRVRDTQRDGFFLALPVTSQDQG